jgi:two-component system NarL family sensor kinase
VAEAQAMVAVATSEKAHASVRGWTVAVAGLSALAWVLGLSGVVVAAVAGTTGRISWPDLTIALAYPAVALLVAHIRQARLWSALTMVSAVFSALNVATSAWADRAYIAHVAGVAGASWAAWAQGWTWVVSVAGFAAIAIFPDSRLPARRWWPAPGLLILGCLLVAAGNALRPRIAEYGIANPFPWHLHYSADLPTGAAILAGLCGCLAAGLAKLRRADSVMRRQIGWYTFGYAVTLVILVLAVTTNLPSAFLAVAPVAIAAGAGVGILQYRLYDLELLVNRTLVWLTLTALSAVLYVVCVGFFQRLFAGAATLGSLLAAGVVAVAFQPLRIRVQHGVNQLVYGYRDQPDVVLRELAQSLETVTDADAVLPALAGTLARSLGLRGVALDVDGGPPFRARYGADRSDLVQAAQARHGGTNLTVLVTPRRGGTVSARDRRLLAGLAPSVATTAESQRLNRALEQARLRALATLAEEQRRMRRDLHDGLGPVLVGLRMTIGSARQLAATEPAAADEILAGAQLDAQTAIDDVRRMARDLRPSALDDLGLASALEDQLSRMVESGCELEFGSSVHGRLLPAAAEVAAYRIACEAVLNVARHARATRCGVRLEADEFTLSVRVQDNGDGFADFVPGVGLRSMRERAEELGGSIEIESVPGAGTTIRADLPITQLTEDGDSP